MKFFASFVRRQQTTAGTSPSTGPTLINPKDYQYVGGGSPRGAWKKAVAPTSTQSPRSSW